MQKTIYSLFLLDLVTFFIKKINKTKTPSVPINSQKCLTATNLYINAQLKRDSVNDNENVAIKLKLFLTSYNQKHKSCLRSTLISYVFTYFCV